MTFKVWKTDDSLSFSISAAIRRNGSGCIKEARHFGGDHVNYVSRRINDGQAMCNRREFDKNGKENDFVVLEYSIVIHSLVAVQEQTFQWDYSGLGSVSACLFFLYVYKEIMEML